MHEAVLCAWKVGIYEFQQVDVKVSKGPKPQVKCPVGLLPTGLLYKD